MKSISNIKSLYFLDVILTFLILVSSIVFFIDINENKSIIPVVFFLVSLYTLIRFIEKLITSSKVAKGNYYNKKKESIINKEFLILFVWFVLETILFIISVYSFWV